MVAVISGQGLGIFGSSVSALGGIGGSGGAAPGRGNDRIYVNSATGNLIVRSQDERLSALGLDGGLIRTYNSQGLLDDDNGDNWRLGVYQRVHELTGTLNGANSTIRKVFGDGREVVYTYDMARAAYVSTEGDGAHDTLSYNSGTSRWTWTDGSGRNTETYNSAGQLTASSDADGNTVTYGYTGSLLTQITDASGQVTYLDYSGTDLTQIRVVSDGRTETLTHYVYDTNHRLSQVQVDLSPGDNSIADNNLYTTSYTYEGASRRIASVTQSDGSSVSFTYELLDGVYRVRTYTDAEGRVTTLTYTQGQGTGSTQNYSLNTGALTTPPGGWSTETLESDTVESASPQIAYDGSGNAVVVWAQGNEIFARRFAAATQTWSAPVVLDALGNAAYVPKLAVDVASGNAVVAWVQSDGTADSLYVSVLNASTGTWSAAQSVESSAEPISNSIWGEVASVSIVGTNAAVAWEQREGATARVYLSRLQNGVWSSAVQVSADCDEDTQPKVAIDASANVTVVWRQLVEEGDHRIFFNRWSAATQSFSGATPLSVLYQGERSPQLFFDAQGNGFALWGNGAFVTRYDAASNSWSAPLALSDDPETAASWNLAVDAAGNAIAAWVEGWGDGNALYARRYDAASGTWSTAALLESATPVVDVWSHIPAVAIHGDRATVAWVQNDGTNASLYGARLASGVWSSPALLESLEFTPFSVSAAIDSAGRIEVCWQQPDGYDYDSIFHAHYSPGAVSYTVPSGATWQSIANTLYGANSAEAGAALQAALGNPPLTTGMQLSGLPTTLAVSTGGGAESYLQTVVQNALGQTTTYSHDASGRLIGMLTPAGGGATLETRYGYDADGNLTSITQDPNGANQVTTFEYDANGNLLTTRDRAGNTVTRTYDSNNQLLTETQYLMPDPDGAGSGQPSAPLTTRYVYDAESHLRFTISAQGGVTEHQYSGAGQRILTRTFVNAAYNAVNFAESDLTTWVAAQDLSRIERIDYGYDFRGNLSSLTTWASTTSSGAGAAGASTTRFVYDQRGQLLQTIEARGSTSTPDASNPNLPYATTYVYDGLGRVLSTTQWISGSTVRTSLNSYDDANRRTITTLANGLISTSTYNRAGELISMTNGTSSATASLGTTTYAYDAAGRLRIVTGPTMSRQFYLYDAAGRKVGEIDGDGTLTEFIYDGANNLIKTVQYAALVDSGTLSSLVDSQGNPTQVTLATVRAAASGNPTQDRITRAVYDSAGRQIYAIDEIGAVTQYVFDGAGRRTEEVRYKNAVTIDRSVDRVLADGFTVTESIDDRRTRYFYDADGNLRGTLDGEGYLLEYRYDTAGRLIEQIGYANRIPSAQRRSDTFAQLIASAGIDDETSIDPERDIRSYFFYDGHGNKIGVLDAEGYLTETAYDAAGYVSSTTRYDRVLTYTAGTSTFQTLKAAATGATSRSTSYQYDGAGRVTQQVDHEGTITTYVYNSAGQLISTTRAATTAEARTTQTRYDFLGRVTQELTGEGSEQLAALTNPTQAQIDDIWDRYGVTYAYDLAGRKISATVRPNPTQTNTTLYFYDADGRLRFEVNALGERKEYRYNALNQVTEEIAYVNRISTSGLSGGLLDDDRITVLTADADGTRDARTTYEYSLTGRVTSERISRTASADDDAITTFLYNELGDQIAQIQKIDGTRTLRIDYTFDRRGLLTETRRDASGINVAESSTYDAFGRLTTTTDARGNVWTTGYDRLGRAITSTDPGTPTRAMTYDAFGQVLTRTDALGNTTTYAYDVAQRRVTVTSPEGVVTSAVHNRHGETVTVFDGRGTPTSYVYDSNGQLKSVTTAAGTTTQNYDRAGRHIETIDANNVRTVYTYDAANRVLTRSVDPAGLNLTSKTFYDGRGQSVWQQDANGVWTQLQYNRDGELVTVIVDPLDVPSPTSTQTSTTLVGNPTGLNLRTDYTYDLRGKTLTVTEGVGSAQPKVTRYEYDRLGRRIEEAVDPSGLNLRTIYTYDANDNVVAKTDARGDVTRYVYNVRNELTYSVDGTGAVVLNEYDAEGRVIQTTAYANRISFTSPTALPLVISAADILLRLQPNAAADQITRTVYNRDGRVHYLIDAMGGVSELTYDDAGNVVQTTRYFTRITVPGTVNEATIGQAITTVPAYDQTERTVYDTANRAIFEIDAEGYVTQLVYDGEGRVIRTIQYTNPIAGTFTTNVAPQIVTTAPGSGSYVIRNDESDRVIRTIYDAAGRSRFSVDGEGYVTEFRYDAQGRQTDKIQYAAQYTVGDAATVTSLTGQVPAIPGDNEPVEKRIYDAAGRLTHTIDAENVVTLHVYDAVGRETDTTVAYGTSEASTTHRVFNAAGYLVEETQGYGTPEAAITRYIVDGLGNRTHIIDPRAYELAETDSAWAQAMRTSLGYPATASSLTSAQRSALRALYATAQEFDASGNIIKVTDSSGRTIGTEYDAFGNAVKVTDQRGYSGYFYFDKNNQMVLQVDPEGYVTRTAYNAFGEAETIVHYAKKVVGAANSSSAPAIVTEVPDPVTGPYLLVDSAHDQTTVIQYDRRGLQTRITDAESNYETMAYDAFGNKTVYRDKRGSVYNYTFYRTGNVRTQTSPSVTVTTVDASGTVSSSTQTLVTEFTYDGRGNVTLIREALGLGQQRDTVIAYDRLNREVRRDLPEIIVFNGTSSTTDIPYTTTTYDRRGNVVQVRDAAGGRTISYYDALNRKVAAVDATGALSEYVYDDAGNLTHERTYSTQLHMGEVVWTTRPSAQAGDTYREMEYVYDANNRRVKSLTQAEVHFDPRLLATLDNGNSAVTTSGYIDGRIANLSFYDATGNVVMTVDGRGYGTLFFYNRLGQQILTVDALGYVTAFEYDGNGNVTRQSKYEHKLSNSTIAALTPASDVQAIVGEVEAADGQDRIIEFEYDRLGRKQIERTLSVRYQQVSDTGVLSSYEQAIESSFDYDAAGNLTQVIKADGSQTNYEYDELGRLERQVDPLGDVYTGMSGATVLTIGVRATTEWQYDALGNRTVQTRLGLTPSDNQVTRARYDDQGNAITEWDAMNNRTDYDVDSGGRIVRQSKTAVDVDGSSHTYRTYFSYDELNRELSRRIDTDAVAGDSSWTSYNAFGDISARGLNDTTQTEYRYDKLGNLFWTNADTGTPRVYVYDATGNAVIEVSQADGADLNTLTSPAEVPGIAPGLVQMKFSIYDARNQLTDVFQAPMDFTGLTGALTAEQIQQLANSNTNTVGTMQPVSGGSNPPLTDPGPQHTRGPVNAGGSLSWSPPANSSVTTVLNPASVSQAVHGQDPVSVGHSDNTYYDAPGVTRRVVRDAYWDGEWLYETVTITIDTVTSSTGAPVTTTTGPDEFDYESGTAEIDHQTTTTPTTTTTNRTVTTEQRKYKSTQITTTTSSVVGGSSTTNTNLVYYPPQQITSDWYAGWGGPDGMTYYAIKTINVPAISGFGSGPTRIEVWDGAGNKQWDLEVTGARTLQCSENEWTLYPNVYRLRLTKGGVTLFDGDPSGFTNAAVSVTGASSSTASILLSTGAGGAQWMSYYSSMPGGPQWIAMVGGANTNWQYNLYDAGSTLLGAVSGGSLTNPASRSYYYQTTVVQDFYRQQTTDLATSLFQQSDTAQAIQQSNYLRQLMYSIVSGDEQSNQIHRSNEYNAFGEVSSETDGRRNVTQYQYNELGQLIRKQNPTVAATDEHGVVDANFTPVTEYYVDAVGQTIGSKDANQHTTTAAIRNGRVVAQFNPDGWVKRSYYDVFGNEAAVTAPEIALTTRYQYDKNNQLVRTDFAGGNYDVYEYDALGNRIAHTNGIGNRETYKYDAEGRITRYRSAENRETQYIYTFDSSIGERGGYRKRTIDAMSNEQIDEVDMFGKIRSHTDLEEREYTYNYNGAGWLTSQTSTAGQDIEYVYYANGYLKEINDSGINSRARFEYDKDGNRTLESYSAQTSDAGEVIYGLAPYQMATATYDALNRVVSIEEEGKYTIEYEYDGVGNRRRVLSTYHDLLSNEQLVQDFYYKYDSMNRFTTTMGQLVNGEIVRGSTGYDITYNGADQRKTQRTTDENGNTIKETYAYDDNGYLTTVSINPDADDVAGDGVVRARRTNNAVGDRDYYYEYNSAGVETSSHHYTYDRDHILKQDHDIANNRGTNYWLLADGRVDKTVSYNNVDTNAATVTFQYQYEGWDSYKQQQITVTGIANGIDGWRNGVSSFQYDVNGHLDEVYDHADDRTIHYINNQNGQTLKRLEWSGTDTVIKPEAIRQFYYLYGKAVGDQGLDGSQTPSRVDYAQELRGTELEGNGNKTYVESRRLDSLPAQWQQWNVQQQLSYLKRGGDPTHYTSDGSAQQYQHQDIGARVIPVASADFDQNFLPINENYPPATAGTYVVVLGDTLRTIAAAVWGDSSLWYLISEANGFSGDIPLVADMRLVIPNVVTNIHNNSTTFRPVDPGLALGDTSPTLPQPPPPPPPAANKGCGALGMILVIIVAIVVTVFTAGIGTAAAGSGLSGIMSAGVATLGGGFSTTALVAGAVGAAASQGVAMAMGMQKEFDWSGVAMGAVGSAIGAGIGKLASNVSSLSWLNATSGVSGFGAQVVRGAIGNAATQGVSMAAGLQKQFSWSQVAASAVGAGVGNSVGNWLGKTIPNTATQFTKQLVTGFGNAAASAGVYEAITGERANYGMIAAQSFGTALGNSIVETAAINGRANALLERAGLESDRTNHRYSSDFARALVEAGLSDEDVLLVLGNEGIRAGIVDRDATVAGGLSDRAASRRAVQFVDDVFESIQARASAPAPATPIAAGTGEVLEEVAVDAKRVQEEGPSGSTITRNVFSGGIQIVDGFTTLAEKHGKLASVAWEATKALVTGGPAKAVISKIAKITVRGAVDELGDQLAAIAQARTAEFVTGLNITADLSIAGERITVEAADFGNAAGELAGGTVDAAFDAGVKQIAQRGEAIRNVVHKNSRDYKGDSHVYEIRNPDGSRYKIGKSSRGKRQDGQSKRAEEQVRDLDRKDIANGGQGGYASRIRKDNLAGSGDALDYETRLRDRYRRMYGQDLLPGNREHLRGPRKKE